MGFNDVAEAAPEAVKFFRLLSDCIARSDLSLPRRRAKNPWAGLLALGDRCASFSSRVISEYELGVGLDGRPRRLDLEVKAAPRAEG